MAVLKQDHFLFDEFDVVECVLYGHKRLYDIRKEKDALYMKEDFTDEDGIKAAELEGEFAELDGWAAESNAEMLLNGLGVTNEFHYAKMKELTGGQKVKVLLAQALFGNPDILLLDEPLGALDAFTRMNMQDEILNIWREQKQTVVMVTHDVEEAIYMGTRVLVMEPRPGRVKADIPIELAEPKQRDSEEFQAYRNRILKMLDLKHHTDH